MELKSILVVTLTLLPVIWIFFVRSVLINIIKETSALDDGCENYDLRYYKQRGYRACEAVFGPISRRLEIKLLGWISLGVVGLMLAGFTVLSYEQFEDDLLETDDEKTSEDTGQRLQKAFSEAFNFERRIFQDFSSAYFIGGICTIFVLWIAGLFLWTGYKGKGKYCQDIPGKLGRMIALALDFKTLQMFVKEDLEDDAIPTSLWGAAKKRVEEVLVDAILTDEEKKARLGDVIFTFLFLRELITSFSQAGKGHARVLEQLRNMGELRELITMTGLVKLNLPSLVDTTVFIRNLTNRTSISTDDVGTVAKELLGEDHAFFSTVKNIASDHARSFTKYHGRVNCEGNAFDTLRSFMWGGLGLHAIMVYTVIVIIWWLLAPVMGIAASIGIEYLVAKFEALKNTFSMFGPPYSQRSSGPVDPSYP